MKFETLKKDNRKYWIIGSIVVIIIASVVFFVGTRANYKITQKVNIANGIINWSPSDLDIVSIKISSDGLNYSDTDTVPTSGYKLNTEKSMCKVNGSVDSNITIRYSNGESSFLRLKRGTKCTLYFDEKCGNACKTLLSSRTIDNSRNAGISGMFITDTSSTATTKGKIFSVVDDDGTSYVYSGIVNDNWVKFGGFYWRIIRINGDGTIRLIYNGTDSNETGTSTMINGSNSYQFNSGSTDNKYFGYMYTAFGSHGLNTSSLAKNTIDSWYETNLNKIGIKEYIDINAGFCGDRGSSMNQGDDPNDTGGITNIVTFYAPGNRLYSSGFSVRTTAYPTLKCADNRDLYTVSSSNKGNKALTYPIGLISSDEVVIAGGFAEANNKSYYLYNGQNYWTMSPDCFNNGYAWHFRVDSNGSVSTGTTTHTAGFRPVINLKADIVFKAGTDGTKTNPYEVV